MVGAVAQGSRLKLFPPSISPYLTTVSLYTVDCIEITLNSYFIVLHLYGNCGVGYMVHIAFVKYSKA